eukprot:scaffold14709_cov173-Skeletonema_dohrnii-CCMP3373.AAC.3
MPSIHHIKYKQELSRLISPTSIVSIPMKKLSFFEDVRVMVMVGGGPTSTCSASQDTGVVLT